MHIGLPEVIFVLILILLVFGTKKLPDTARSIGQAMKEFKKGLNDVKDEINMDEEDQSNQKKK